MYYEIEFLNDENENKTEKSESSDQPRKQYRQYSENSLKQAIEAIKNGGKIKAISKEFKINESTLRRKLKRDSNAENLTQACKDVILNKMSFSKAAEKHKVSKSTIHRRVQKMKMKGICIDPPTPTVPQTQIESKIDTTLLIRKKEEFMKRLEAAIRDCRQGISPKKSAKLHKIPLTVLQRNVRGIKIKKKNRKFI